MNSEETEEGGEEDVEERSVPWLLLESVRGRTRSSSVSADQAGVVSPTTMGSEGSSFLVLAFPGRKMPSGTRSLRR